MLAVFAIVALAAAADDTSKLYELTAQKSFPICEAEQHPESPCYFQTNFTDGGKFGTIVEYFDADTPFCMSSIQFPSQRLWSKNWLAFIYFIGLCYCFLGVAIISDLFMAAIEVITSQEITVKRKAVGSNEYEEVTVTVWNPTVANLSLMALGSSAPEILLAVIGTVSTLDGTPDVLGPATIVGSAAYNLLMISAVCILSIPEGELRYVKQTSVYAITAFTSVFAYVWMFIVLSDDKVEVWEAWFTLMMFPALVISAWVADNNFFMDKKDAVGNLGEQRVIGIEMTAGDGKKVRSSIAASKEDIAKMATKIKAEKKYASTQDLEAKVVANLQLQEKPPTRMTYRINAIRGLSGKRRNLPDGQRMSMSAIMEQEFTNARADAEPITNPLSDGGLLDDDDVPDNTAVFRFKASTYAVMENAGTIELTVERLGVTNFPAQVSYYTIDGTATTTGDDADFVPVSEDKPEVLKFEPGVAEMKFKITIIDDSQWEPDETFEVQLVNPYANGADGKQAMIGHRQTTEVTILNDDNPGILSFSMQDYSVKESHPHCDVTVTRKNGCDGIVSVNVKTIDDTAIHEADYHAVDTTITFEHGETSKTVPIAIIDTDKDEATYNKFKVLLSAPTGGAQLSSLKYAEVKILHDDQFTGMVSKVTALMKLRAERMSTGTSSWGEQFSSALTVEGPISDTGEELPPSTMDYVFHLLTIGWKVLFAFCPPTTMGGGWVCFVVAIIFIGMLTFIVGELAALFGCTIGLKTSVTAITFVALGTSLPDTFASKAAAVGDPYADASIGNVTGSNAVNIFLGLGLPWVIGTLYKGGTYDVPKGDLAFSVKVFVSCACTCLLTLQVRRMTVGGELGGSGIIKKASAAFLMSLWFIYIILASLKAYGHFD
jgi:solute carrier family 8 (sodium/calcium exchanger)